MKTFKQFSEESEPSKPVREPVKPNLAQRIDRSAEVAKQAFHSAMARPRALGSVATTIAKPLVKTGVGAGTIAGKVAKSTATGISHGISDFNKRLKQQAHDAATRQSNVPVEKS